MKKLMLPVFIVLIIAFSVVIAFISAPEKKEEAREEYSTSEIMYFYSDNCTYCIKQKPILEELEEDGVKFKYMDVEANREYFDQYSISGTPYFIIGNTRLSGYQSKEKIRELWEKYNQ